MGVGVRPRPGDAGRRAPGRRVGAARGDRALAGGGALGAAVAAAARGVRLPLQHDRVRVLGMPRGWGGRRARADPRHVLREARCRAE